MCEDYRGGGFSDWRMPTLAELSLICENLRKPGKIGGGTFYWSSTPYSDTYYAGMKFSSYCYKENLEPSDVNSVRAIRVYKK